MIGIIGAMDEEVAVIKNKLTNIEEKVIAGCHFYKGKLNDKSVVLLKSGIGKVNASVATTILFENFEIAKIINIGTAGGVKNNCEVLDIVISTKVAYHDVDVTAFGYKYGQVPKLPLFFESDNDLVNKVETILSNENFTYHKGLIVSGDAFINNEKQRIEIIANFNEAIAVEMEACSIAQVCFMYNKPFIILRSLSDIAGKESSISFDTYLHKASLNSAIFVEKLINII